MLTLFKNIYFRKFLLLIFFVWSWAIFLIYYFFHLSNIHYFFSSLLLWPLLLFWLLLTLLLIIFAKNKDFLSQNLSLKFRTNNKIFFSYLEILVFFFISAIFLINILGVKDFGYQYLVDIFREQFNILSVLVFPTVIFIWVIIAGLSLGLKIIKKTRIQFDVIGEKYLFSLGIGWGLIMYLMFFLGVFGLYYRLIIYLITFLISIFSWSEVKELFGFLKNRKVSWSLGSPASLRNLLILVIFIVTIFNYIGAFKPIPNVFDDLHTYLNLPHVYITEHKIVNFPYWPYFNFPQNSEMLFSWGMLLGNHNVAMLFPLIILCSLFLVLIITKRYFGERAAYLSSLFFYLFPIILAFSTFQTKTEPLLIFYVLLAMSALLNFIATKQKRWLILAAIFSGVSFGIKYTAILNILPFVLLISYYSFQQNKKQRFLNLSLNLTIFISLIVLLFLPWGIKNIISNGSPLAPFYFSNLSKPEIFENQLGANCLGYSNSRFANYSILDLAGTERQDLGYFIKLPFWATFNVKGTSNDQTEIGPFFLILFPLMFFLFFKKKNIFFSLLFWYSLFGFLFWEYLGAGVIWYGISVLLGLIILTGHIISNINNKSIKLLLESFLLIFICLSFSYRFLTFSMPDSYRGNPAGYLIGKESREEFLQHHLEVYDLYSISQYINQHLVVNKDLVWGVNEPRSYYIKNNNKLFVPDYYFGKLGCLLANDNTEDYQLTLDKLKELGVNYFLYADEDIDENKALYETFNHLYLKEAKANKETAEGRLVIDNFRKFREFRDRYLRLTARYGVYNLYKVQESI